MPVKTASRISAGERRQWTGNVATQVLGADTQTGQRIADDMAALARLNLTTGGGSTALSTAGFGKEVRRGAGYPHVASKATLDSIKVSPVRRGRYSRRWVISVGGAASALEYGVRPGAPVTEQAIRTWMNAKGMAAGKSADEADSLARYITEKIRRRGLAATRFWTSAEDVIRGRLRGTYYNSKRRRR